MSFPTRRFGGSYKRLLSVRRIRSWRSRDVGYVYGFVRTFGAYISIDSTVGKWPIVSGIFYEIPHGSSACSLNRIKRPVSPLSVANNAFISSDTIDITKRLNRILRAHVHLVCKGERSMNRCFYRRCMLAVVYIRNSRSSYLYMIVSKLQPCNSNSKAESDGGKVHQILPKVFFFRSVSRWAPRPTGWEVKLLYRVCPVGIHDGPLTHSRFGASRWIPAETAAGVHTHRRLYEAGSGAHSIIHGTTAKRISSAERGGGEAVYYIPYRNGTANLTAISLGLYHGLFYNIPLATPSMWHSKSPFNKQFGYSSSLLL